MANVTATIRVEDNGSIHYLDANGEPLSDRLVNLAKRQQGDNIRQMLARASEQINSEPEGLARIHIYTPPPNETPRWQRQEFGPKPPIQAAPREVSLFARFLGKKAGIDAENAEALRAFEQSLADWNRKKSAFEFKEDQLSQEFDDRLRNDVEFMQQILEENLADIVWPRETIVSFETRDPKALNIDVDLPEIEEMPTRTASVPERGYKLSIKQIRGKALQDLYARHVYGIGFRIIGEAFATLPLLEHVTLSGFTQRVSTGTGQLEDVYVFSVRAHRQDWEKINFHNIESIDVVAALGRFELRSKPNRSGVLESIVPIDASGNDIH